MVYMLDTNICIYIIKNKSPQVLKALKTVGVGNVCISAITLAELEYGVEKSRQKEKNRFALTNFLVPFEILPFNDRAAKDCGKIRAELEKKGQTIGAYDLLIGAHALSENLTLVTNNVNEFKRIADLRIENWVEEKR